MSIHIVNKLFFDTFLGKNCSVFDGKSERLNVSMEKEISLKIRHFNG